MVYLHTSTLCTYTATYGVSPQVGPGIGVPLGTGAGQGVGGWAGLPLLDTGDRGQYRVPCRVGAVGPEAGYGVDCAVRVVVYPWSCRRLSVPVGGRAGRTGCPYPRGHAPARTSEIGA